MYYELYIDIFFLVNFIMDLYILLVAKKILKCPTTYREICLGSMCGALGTCVVVVLPVTNGFVKFMVFHGLINFLMIKTGLRIRTWHSFFKAYVIIYASSFMIGGVFYSFRQYLREWSVFVLFAGISYFIVLHLWSFLFRMDRNRKISCEVILITAQNEVKVNAILDTGNRLRDPLTGKAVSVISGKIAKLLWQEIPKEGLRYIPYHTIGKKEGVLPVFAVEKMCICQEDEKWFSKCLVAVSEELTAMGTYDVILNPDVK